MSQNTPDYLNLAYKRLPHDSNQAAMLIFDSGILPSGAFRFATPKDLSASFSGEIGDIVIQTDELETLLSGLAGKQTSVSNSNPSGSNGQILSANSERVNLYIKNMATGDLYVSYNGSANQNNFNFALNGALTQSGVEGDSLSDQNWGGVVHVSGVGDPYYISWEY